MVMLLYGGVSARAIHTPVQPATCNQGTSVPSRGAVHNFGVTNPLADNKGMSTKYPGHQGGIKQTELWLLCCPTGPEGGRPGELPALVQPHRHQGGFCSPGTQTGAIDVQTTATVPHPLSLGRPPMLALGHLFGPGTGPSRVQVVWQGTVEWLPIVAIRCWRCFVHACFYHAGVMLTFPRCYCCLLLLHSPAALHARRLLCLHIRSMMRCR